MSTGYTVVVPHERWPSNAAMQASLDARGYPVVLVDVAAAAPFAADARGVIALRLDGRLHRLVQVGAAQVSGVTFASDDTNQVLAELGADFRARDGDWHFGVGLGSDPRDWRAAFLIMAALVKDFGGYGYETQAESHGGDAWAGELVEAAEHFRLQAAAADAAPRLAPVTPVATAGSTQERIAGVVCIVIGAGCGWLAAASGNILTMLVGGVLFAMGIAVFFIPRRA